MTHLEANAIYTSGNKEAAWEIAKMDEGLLPEVTFEIWCDWMDKVIGG